MMSGAISLEKTVRQIFQENTTYIHPQQALNQARSLNSLSADIYTDPLRFVFELIQNCDDSCNRTSQVRIAIVENQYLIVSHTGKAFDSMDVRGLCDVGCGTKGRDRTKTGYKGLGFKSVFGKSNYVVILSDGEYFRFEKNSKVFQWNQKWAPDQKTWEERNQRKFEYPWQICPIWTKSNEVPPSTMKWLLGFLKGVATIIRLNNVNETISAIEQLKQEPHLFMFLRNIRNIRFTINSSQETLLNIRERHDGSLEVRLDQNKVSHWILNRFTLDVIDAARQDSRLPEKLQEETTTEIILAARIDQNDCIESVQGRHNALFSYLPTKITTYNLPIIVNGQFVTNASREHIHTDSPWNQFLFASIPQLMIRWIAILVKQKWKERAYDLMPKEIPIKDPLAIIYNENCSNAPQNLPFLINSDNELLRLDQAVIDKTRLVLDKILPERLTRDLIIHLWNQNPHLAENPFVNNNNRIRRFPIFVFDWNHCFELFQSPAFLVNFTVEDNIQWINYLFSHQREGHTQNRLLQLILIMNQNGILYSIENIFVPSQFNQSDWTNIGQDNDNYVHDRILLWLRTNNAKILQWLMSLGLREKNDLTFIHTHILPRVTQYINRNNAFDTIRKLFDLFQRNQLTNQILFDLRKLKLFASDEKLVPANQLYLSARYQPRFSIENFNLDRHYFLSEIYLNELGGQSIQRIKEFFLSLGVQDDIRLIQYNQDDPTEIISAYYYRQTDRSIRQGHVLFQNRWTFPFLELTQSNYQFALMFWTHVINSIDCRRLHEKEILLVNQQMFQVDNLIFWFVQNRNCLPTTTNILMKSEDIFSSDLKPLVADYLPAFACQTRSPFPLEWQAFFQFKTQLSIKDHLDILEAIQDRVGNEMIDDETQNLIQRIYKNLIICLSKMNQSDREESSPRERIHLLNTNNEYLLTDELIISLNKDFRLPPSILQLKLSPDNLRHPHLKYLLEFFDIHQIQLNDFTLSPSAEFQSSTELNAKIRELRKYLYELVVSRRISNHQIDCDLQFFEIERLELFYDRTPILQVPVYISENQIYVRQSWRENDVLSKLSDILCEKFRLPSTVKDEIFKFLSTDTISTNIFTLNSIRSIDLVNIDEPRKGFAKEIDRDNQQLFHQLALHQCQDSKEFLLTVLQIQNSPHSGYVYHYTNLENAVEILRQKTLKSRLELQSDQFKDSSPSHLIQNLTDERKNYVHFYFRPCTPAQCLIENLPLIDSNSKSSLCPVPVFLRFNLSSLLHHPNLQWSISLGDLSNPHVEFGHDIDVVKKFDYSHIYDDIRFKRGRESSQQEFLVHGHLMLDQFLPDDITVIVQDSFHQSTLLQLIEHPYTILVDPSHYFGFKPRLVCHSNDSSREINVSIQNRLESMKDGQIILQIYDRIDDQTLTGDINAMYQRNTISTTYFKSQFYLKTDLNLIKYAIYYYYENQIWLIHTNSSHSKFISPQ